MNKRGWTCGAFDVLHPGHIELFKDAKSKCDYLMVGLQVDPSVDRPYKHKPIQSVVERFIMLESIKYVDEIIIYRTEKELIEILSIQKPDIRINGSDWTNKKFTGHNLDIPHHFHQRNHSWSTTNIRERIYEEEKKLRNTQ
jgi:glycerol-3-phosphate cytidylyltransferase